MAEFVTALEVGRRHHDAGNCHASVCRLADLALSLLGPHGRHVMVHRSASSDALLISSISHRLCQVDQNPSLAGQLLIQSTVASQHAAFGDGGLFALALAASLVERVMRESRGVVMTRLMMLQGVQLALDWCMECIYGEGMQQCLCPMCPREAAKCQRMELSGRLSTCCSAGLGSQLAENQRTGRASDASEHTPQLARRLAMRDATSMMALVRSVLSPKRVALSERSEVDTLCALIVGAFVASIPTGGVQDAGQREGQRGPCVRTVEVIGLPPSASERLQGVLLDTRLPKRAAELLPIKDTTILLFDIPLDIDLAHAQPKGTGSRANVVVESFHLRSEARTAPEAGGHPSLDCSAQQLRIVKGIGSHGIGAHEVGRKGALGWRGQLGLLERVAEWAEEMHIGVVASQKVIHPYLQERLGARGIVALERLSVRHVAAVARVSGARPVSGSSPCAEWADSLGSLSQVSVKSIASSQYVLLEPPEVSRQLQGTAPVATLVLCAWSGGAVQELAAVASSALRVLTRALHNPLVVSGKGHFEASLARHVQAAAEHTFSLTAFASSRPSDDNRGVLGGERDEHALHPESEMKEKTGQTPVDSCDDGGSNQSSGVVRLRAFAASKSAFACWPPAHVKALQSGALALQDSLSQIALTVGKHCPCDCSETRNSSLVETEVLSSAKALTVGSTVEERREDVQGCMHGVEMNGAQVEILDLLDVKVGALKRAVDAAYLVLRSTLAS